jgi:hypothetical protein
MKMTSEQIAEIAKFMVCRKNSQLVVAKFKFNPRLKHAFEVRGRAEHLTVEFSVEPIDPRWTEWVLPDIVLAASDIRRSMTTAIAIRR